MELGFVEIAWLITLALLPVVGSAGIKIGRIQVEVEQRREAERKRPLSSRRK